ncbi:type II toxin-antitoxin system HicB family antitoxin [Crocosphaera chwakensis]|uniref:HicB-like protein n=1 Tax=Crocosphaera chwakensis CCY0110 TaxID=391612 RepID=A3ISD3_9CHRO|nr:type II toxin-antitoxin system HicB family antitoxin [Crocosphaera chwakensis]EAZ90649.1 HicB-like protein [Crocosphaera chwakensis CCY0110]
MKNMMEYQGYFGSVNYDDQEQIFYGKVEYIRSLISYEGYDVKSLRTSFIEAVDDYLEICENKGIEPEQSFAGNLTIKPGSELHKRAAIVAQQRGIALDKLIQEALEQYLKS